MNASEDDLRKELATARQNYELALAEMKLTESVHGDLGGQHPDSHQALQNANRRLARAGARFQDALKRFSEAVLRAAETHQHPGEKTQR